MLTSQFQHRWLAQALPLIVEQLETQITGKAVCMIHYLKLSVQRGALDLSVNSQFSPFHRGISLFGKI